MTGPPPDTTSIAHRLAAATNAHDIDALVACFADDYRNDTPVHPSRGFRGADQVRRTGPGSSPACPISPPGSWPPRLRGTPSGRSGRCPVSAPTARPTIMRGVIIFGVRDGTAAWARFYLEPVDQSGDDVDVAIGRATGEPQQAGRR